MNAYNLIYKKREGKKLEEAEIHTLVKGFTKGEIPSYQMAAFLMTVYFSGMEKDELNAFTRAMTESGDIIDLGDCKNNAVDKHSTGGVGDGVSLSLAPLAASLGIIVPMISGRGLGHTGGTLDKLESIPGFNVRLAQKEFKQQLDAIGVCIMGQTEDIAPADRVIYSLRDVTATVDSIPLIAASIMSKKLAEGASGLVLDVKTGSGAFMKDLKGAKKLAESISEIGLENNMNMGYVISDMNQPLGRYAGNSLEIKQAVDIMSGKGPEDIVDLTTEIAGMMLLMGKKVKSMKKGKQIAKENLLNGNALEKFSSMVKMQGGNPDVCHNPDRVLNKAKNVLEVKAERDGYIKEMDARIIGLCCVSLGAGREKMDQKIDHSAGIEVIKKIGDKVYKGDITAKLYSSSSNNMEEIALEYLNAVEFDDSKISPEKLIYKKRLFN